MNDLDDLRVISGIFPLPFLHEYTPEDRDDGYFFPFDYSQACDLIYGYWKSSSGPFSPRDYNNYSLEARKSIVSVLTIYEMGRNHLVNIWAGLKLSPDFISELELWQEWGLPEEKLQDIARFHFCICEQLDDPHTYANLLHWENFVPVLDYTRIQMNAKEAETCRNLLAQATALSEELRAAIAVCIERHTMA